MNNDSTLIKCCRCGYSFTPRNNLRCPRCYNPVLTCGGCTGSCGSCAANQLRQRDGSFETVNLPKKTKKQQHPKYGQGAIF